MNGASGVSGYAMAQESGKIRRMNNSHTPPFFMEMPIDFSHGWTRISTDEEKSSNLGFLYPCPSVAEFISCLIVPDRA